MVIGEVGASVDPCGPRDRKRERTRHALIAAAADLFERNGYDGTTVAEIAAAAGSTGCPSRALFAADPWRCRVTAAAPRLQRLPKGRSNLLRSELLTAAEATLAERGRVDAITVDAVAKRAGVSTTAVYLHFSGRAELIYETVHGMWRQVTDELLDAVVELPDALARIGARGGS